MSILAQHLVLSCEQSLDGTHQRTAFTGKVRIYLLLEGGFEQVSRSDADTECNDTVVSAARSILIDGIARIESLALKEQTAQRRSRTLRSDHDHIHVGRRNDASTVIVGDAEAVREVECLAGRQVLLHGRPYGNLTRIRQQILNDSTAFAGLFDIEQVLSRNPTVCYGLVPRLRVLALTHNDIETVVLQVERLARSLNSVTDDGYYFILEHLACLAERKLFAGYDILFDPAKIHLCHFSKNL